ncbi:hypothetical protein J437_LFUL017009 [Ladona fulva]|uniref:Endonuclease/exonuclease/phosphatase domain-containing protein n=1 Tax=Ladona fulva TaxID=123851 RepID=A0A8K0KM41_LADFU|nr:hypothetical protein J437_LFUL017009 [Ladona fulva]
MDIPAAIHTMPDDCTPNKNEAIAADIAGRGRKRTIITYYSPPKSHLPLLLLQYLLTLTNPFIIVGDLNARHTAFHDTRYNSREQNFFDSWNNTHSSAFPFPLLIFSPTKDAPFQIMPSSAPPWPPSLFLPSTVCRSANNASPKALMEEGKLDRRPEPRRRKPVAPICFLPLSLITDISNSITHIIEAFLQATKLHIPLTSYHRIQMRVPPEALSLLQEKKLLLRQYQRNRDPNTKREWNRLNALVKSVILHKKGESWTRACSRFDHREGSCFWQHFRTLSGLNYKPPTILRDNQGNLLLTKEEETEAFKQSIQVTLANIEERIFDVGHKKTSESHVLHLPRQPASPSDDDPIMAHTIIYDIEDAIRSANDGAPGPDGIHYRMLKNTPAATTKAVHSLPSPPRLLRTIEGSTHPNDTQKRQRFY